MVASSKCLVYIIKRFEEPEHIARTDDGRGMYSIFDCTLYLSYMHLFDEETKSIE